MATPAEELKKIEKATVRLRNKIKRADLDYTVQISIASTDPTVLRYAAQLTSPAKGLAPITFISLSVDDLVKKIKEATKHLNYDEVEIAYHKEQIEACKRTITGHEEAIEAIKNPETTDEAEQEPTQEETQDDKKEAK